MNAEDALMLWEQSAAARLLGLWEEERWSLTLPVSFPAAAVIRPFRQENFPGEDEKTAADISLSPDETRAAGPETGGAEPLLRRNALAAAENPSGELLTGAESPSEKLFAAALAAYGEEPPEEIGEGTAALSWLMDEQGAGDAFGEVPETSYTPARRSAAAAGESAAAFAGQGLSGAVQPGSGPAASFPGETPDIRLLYAGTRDGLSMEADAAPVSAGDRTSAAPETAALTADGLLDELERRLLRQIQTETEGFYR